jgi:hypothetical protein
MICNNTKEPEFITGLWSNEKWNFKDALQLSPNANILDHTDLEVRPILPVRIIEKKKPQD